MFPFFPNGRKTNMRTNRCPEGESPEEITARIDGVIKEVKEIHRKYFEEGIGGRDVLIVSHGEPKRSDVFLLELISPALSKAIFREHLSLDGSNSTFVSVRGKGSGCELADSKLLATGTHFNMEPAGVRPLYQFSTIFISLN
jgi:broad specificity phosphatase PhoE